MRSHSRTALPGCMTYSRERALVAAVVGGAARPLPGARLDEGPDLDGEEDQRDDLHFRMECLYPPVMTVGFLLCSDPLRPRRADPHFEREARAVREADAPLALVDHDALAAGRAGEAVARVPAGFGPVWYRGWM